MSETGWLTVTEIARRLGRAPSTVTYWRNTFRAELTERADDDGHPSYQLAVFERLDVLMRQRTPRTEIRRELAGTDAESSTPAGRDDLILEELRAIRAAVERIADHLDPPPKEG